MMASFKAAGGALVTAFGVGIIARAVRDMGELGASIVGVRNAFDRLNDPGLLNRMREATRGTIDDLTLMQAAVFSEKFRIPMEVLVKGIEFAGLVALETGEDFEYMMRSFVTGTARESVKILDNLGISAKALSEEIKITGDFMTSLENIMDRELTKMRSNIDETVLSYKQLTIELENQKQELSLEILPAWISLITEIKEATKWWRNFFNSGDTETTANHLDWMSGNVRRIGDGLVRIVSESTTITELTEEQIKAAKKLREQWDGISSKLQKDVLLLGLNPQHKKMIELMMTAEEYRQKFESIPGAMSQINNWYDQLILKAAALNEIQARGLDPNDPGLLTPSEPINMAQIELMHQIQIDGITAVTDFELAQYSIRILEGQNFYSNMAGAALGFYQASGQASREWFTVYKAFAIAQTAISTYEGAVAAYKAMAGIPVVGPFLGIAAAGALTAYGLGNIARISAMQPGGGFGGGTPSSTPSLPGNVTNNQSTNTRNFDFNITLINQGNLTDDEMDALARRLMGSLRKAEGDGA